MGEGLKRAFAAAKATRKPPVDVRVGDRLKRHGGQFDGVVYTVINTREGGVWVRSDRTGNSFEILEDAIKAPDPTLKYPLRSGFTLLERDRP